MSEIKSDLIRLFGGEKFTADCDGAYVIAEWHTLSDVLRWLVEQSSEEEIKYLLDHL